MEEICSLRVKYDSQKFLATLQEISKEDFSVSDDTILDKLYSHIEQCFNTTDSSMTDIVCWLENTLNGWNVSKYFDGVKVFAVRLIGLVGSSLDGFRVLKSKNILPFVQNFASSDEFQQDPCLMVPLINVFVLFLKHEGGWKWITDTLVWESAVEAFYEDRSMYTKRAGVQFLSLLLNKSNEYDSNHGINILSAILEPLVARDLLIIKEWSENEEYIHSDGVKTEENEVIDVIDVIPQLTRAAKFASAIIGEILSKPNANLPASLLLVFRRLNTTDTCIIQTDILDRCSCPQIEQIFSLLLLMIDLSNASRANLYKKEHQETFCGLLYVYSNIYSTLESIINLKNVYSVINYCVTCLSLCFKLRKMNNMCILGLESNCRACRDFERTMTDTLKVLFCDHTGIASSRKPFMEKDEIEDNLYLNNFVAYNFHQKYLTLLPSDLNQKQKKNVEYMQLGVVGLIRSLPYIRTERIALCLFCDVLTLIDGLVNVLMPTTLPVVLHLLTLAVKLIDECKLGLWKINSCDINALYMIVLRVVLIENIDVRVTIASIQLLKQFLIFPLIPNLMFDNEFNCVLMKLSSLIVKLDSKSWEVRDSTLELFQIMVDFSEINRETMKLYFSVKIIEKIFDVVVNDGSSYVRASALEFFSRTIIVEQFIRSLEASKVCDLALKAVIEDNMAVVRKVACKLVTTLYVTYGSSLLSDAVEHMYDTMLVVINKDLDWEVKNSALIFWECTIRKHLKDKSIPLHPPTNSSYSESNNNVTLRIVEVLKELGRIGCLKAIWLGLNDDCDFKVSQEAYRVLNFLEDLDKVWNYNEHFINPDETEEEDKIEKSPKTLLPNEFHYLVQQQDWNEKLSSRKDWIENTCDDLNSLMDHILNVGDMVDDCDHNAVDCY